MNRERVVVAMSGGVDSSVAAALLKDQGYEVIGITMNLYSLPKGYCRPESIKSCCGWGAAEEANRVAAALRISHYVVDLQKPFERFVVADFCSEYASGRTPNPCIRCNQYIKFDVLLKRAEKLRASCIATGHHARVQQDPRSGRFLLKKGKDVKKDQSYFLYPLTQEQLSRILLPVGNFTKDEVRRKAQEKGLSVAQSPESQEICFIPDENYPMFLKNRKPEAFQPGPIIDISGCVLGEHRGIAHFTIGQRRGIGIAAPHPLYVLKIESKTNRIVVGPNEGLYEKKLTASRVSWVSGEQIPGSFAASVKIRYKHKETQALMTRLKNGKVLAEFELPQRAITPGQAVVFYEGDVVLGGGIID